MADGLRIIRRHDWVAFAAFNLTEEEAANAADDQSSVTLSKRNLRGVQGPVCYVCEAPYETAEESCPGETAWVAEVSMS